MPEWWTYTLADFLMFSPRTYYRLVERYNASIWPAQVAALGLGLLIGVRAFRGPGGRPMARASALVVGLAWAWVGWGFLLERYTRVNWAARWFAVLFAVEAALLAWTAARGGLVFAARPAVLRAVAAGLLGLGLMFYPLLAPLLGRGRAAAEVFGIMPEPTAIATAGLLLLADPPARGLLLVAPIAWLTVAGLTLWAMGSPEGWAVALGLALVLTWWGIVRRPARVSA